MGAGTLAILVYLSPGVWSEGKGSAGSPGLLPSAGAAVFLSVLCRERGTSRKGYKFRNLAF